MQLRTYDRPVGAEVVGVQFGSSCEYVIDRRAAACQIWPLGAVGRAAVPTLMTGCGSQSAGRLGLATSGFCCARKDMTSS